MSTRREISLVQGALWLLLASVALLQLTLLAKAPLIGDEIVHRNQAVRFAVGYFVATPEMTQMPGYHLAIGMMMRAASEHSVFIGRASSLVAATLAALAFIRVRRALHQADARAELTAGQLLLCPIIFPYIWLFYTDIPALAATLWVFYFSVLGKHKLAGLVGLLAILTRQVSVVWVALFAAMLLFGAVRPLLVDWPKMPAGRRLLELWPYVAVGLAFLAYWYWNGSISFSTTMAYAHPDFNFGSSNFFFMLFIIGILFLPMLPVWLARFAVAARQRPLWIGLPVVLFVVYHYTFVVSNPYNYLEPNFIIRNRVLITSFVQPSAFIAMGAVACMAACAITQAGVNASRGVFLTGATLIALGASDLIEQRYYIVALALFLAMRTPESSRRERLLLTYWGVVSIALSAAVMTQILMI